MILAWSMIGQLSNYRVKQNSSYVPGKILPFWTLEIDLVPEWLYYSSLTLIEIQAQLLPKSIYRLGTSGLEGLRNCCKVTDLMYWWSWNLNHSNLIPEPSQVTILQYWLHWQEYQAKIGTSSLACHWERFNKDDTLVVKLESH